MPDWHLKLLSSGNRRFGATDSGASTLRDMNPGRFPRDFAFELTNGANSHLHDHDPPFTLLAFTFTLRSLHDQLHLSPEIGFMQRKRYSRRMASDAAPKTGKLWQPHPDDAEDVGKAMGCADRGDFISPEATEALLRWLNGIPDESWREDHE